MIEIKIKKEENERNELIHLWGSTKNESVIRKKKKALK